MEDSPTPHVRQQEVVADIGQQALETSDIDHLMETVVGSVVETLNTGYCHILELQSAREAFLLREGVGWQPGVVENATIPTDRDSQAGYTLLSKHPIVVDDLRAETRFEENDLLVEHGVGSGITVLIGSVEQPWGVLGTFSDDHRTFSEHDVNFVQSVANVLASAIEKEQTRREREEIYGRISDAFFALDGEWRFTHLNEHAHELINPAGKELEGASVWDEFPAALEREFKPKYERAMYEQETVAFEEYYPEPLDAWYEVRAYPSESGLSVYFRDVTDRKERERELERSEQRYRTLAECFPNGVVTLFDEDCRYTLAAGKGFDDLPVTPDEVEGRRPHEAWGPDVATELEAAMETALEGGEEKAVELSYAGREWVVHAVPVSDEAGDVFAGMTMAQDITEQVIREAKLEESNERLEQFAYAASHDLQEPLRMVSSYLSLLERRHGDDLDAEAEEFLEFAVDGADRMREMIEGLLEYSRVEAQGGAFEPVDLDDVLAEVRRNLRLQIEESGAEISAAALPTVEGDASQLRQVFQNLLSNAIEYSGDEPPVIEIDAERDGDRWRVAVTDEGIGIDPGDQEEIFEVFQRLHSRENHPGTGIGLALTERIVQRHGGDVRVESEPGEGSTFSFSLPAVSGSDT